ncbi:S-layer protein [Caulobacter sp. 1776]|uniref:beta strand repeat-containing protein n=1 Tax=Caulobacter sp. 1776 TaxID=3156420 RepID=UPI003398372E
MALTTAQLVDAYTKANLGKAPDAATTLTLDAYATQTQTGGVTDTTAMTNTLKLVNNTTAVAVETYQFFTGHAPSVAGLTYLVNSTTNTNDLNDTYYSKFAQENRFINFSINLATGAGEGAAAFAAAYGSVTVAQTVATAYDKIIGNAAAAAAGVDVAAAVAYLSRAENVTYLTNFVKANTGLTAAADIDLAVKAALIGEILNAATVSGIGGYAKATAALIADLSDGALSTDNSAGINIITAYPSAPPSVTTALTNAVDNFVGTSANDVINALTGAGGTTDTLTVADKIDGGAGTDTLNITAVGAFTGVPAAVTISNVENINITGTAAVTADSTGFSGVTALGVTSVGAATLTAASTTAVSLTSTQNATGNVSITGGSTVVATLNIADGITAGTVGVSGTASSVTVVNNAVGVAGTGVGAAATIADTGVSATKAGTLTSVSLTGTGAGSTIASNALTNLSLNGTGTVSLTNSLTTPTNTTLALSVAGTVGAITDVNNEVKTLNVSGSATATVANFSDSGLTALNVSGTKVVTFTALSAANLATVTVSGSAGLVADVSALANVKTVDTTATTGASKITLDATLATFAGGAGNDTVQANAAPTKSLVGGAGTDTFVANIAGGFDASANGKISGFETLGLAAASTGSFNATGFTGLSISGAIGGASTFSNVAAGTAITYTGAPGQTVTYNLADSSGTSDAATVNISSSGATAAGTLVLTGVENVTINAVDTNTTAHVDTLTLTDATAKSVTVTGSAGLTLTNTALTALRTFDAHASTGVISYTSAVTTGATTITGSSTNTNTLVGAAAADTITGGAKADTITTGAGLDVVTTGGGADTVILGANANGNTYATITDFTSKAVSATAFDTLDVSALATAGTTNATFALSDKITLGATAAFADFLDAAAAGVGNVNTHATWFTYAGDTYIVLDNSAAATFQNGADQVVKLTGIVDLSTAAFSGADLFTLGN